MVGGSVNGFIDAIPRYEERINAYVGSVSGWLDRLRDRPDLDRRLVKVDVTGYVERGRDALRAHRTQIDPDGFWFQVPTDVVEAVYPWEDFELLVSAHDDDRPDGDLFDGLA